MPAAVGGRAHTRRDCGVVIALAHGRFCPGSLADFLGTSSRRSSGQDYSNANIVRLAREIGTVRQGAVV